MSGCGPMAFSAASSAASASGKRRSLMRLTAFTYAPSPASGVATERPPGAALDAAGLPLAPDPPAGAAAGVVAAVGIAAWTASTAPLRLAASGQVSAHVAWRD